MRWKLLVIAPLAAAVVGTGGSALLLYLLTGRPAPAVRGGLAAALLTLLLPLAAITYASVFVYRHTARRRKLQAAATAAVSLALSLAAYLAFAVLTTCCEPPPERTPPAAPSGVS